MNEVLSSLGSLRELNTTEMEQVAGGHINLTINIGAIFGDSATANLGSFAGQVNETAEQVWPDRQSVKSLLLLRWQQFH